jgi:hypothetical protein
MKKLIFLILILCVFTGPNKIHAQGEGDSTKYLFSEKTVFSGFGSPFIEFSSVNKKFAVCFGGGGAMMINQTLFFGGYFEGIMTNHYRADLQSIVDDENPKISFEHGGIWLGYIHKQKKAIHGGLSMKLGWGEIELMDGKGGNPRSNYNYTDRIFNIQPQAELELNLTKRVKVNLGIGYRIVTDIDATYLNDKGNRISFYDNGDFNSPIGTVTLIFGEKDKKNYKN